MVFKDDTLLQRNWPLAQIVSTYPGPDGLVRVVDVLCQGKIYNRPIVKLVKLISEKESPVPQLPPWRMSRSAI